MTQLKFIIISLIFIFTISWPLNSNLVSLNNSKLNNNKYFNVIEVRDFYIFDFCNNTNSKYKFIIFINQKSNEYSLELNNIFQLENIDSKNTNVININCKSSSGSEQLICDFDKNQLIKSGKLFKIKNIENEIIFNCSKQNSNKKEKCILLPFKTNFQIKINNAYDSFIHIKNTTLLIDFRKNNILKFNIDYSYILNEKPDVIVNEMKLYCNQIPDDKRIGFGKSLECLYNKSQYNYQYSSLFPVFVIDKCDNYVYTNINIVVLNSSFFKNESFYILFIIFLFIF